VRITPEVRGPIRGMRPPWGDPGPAAVTAGYVVEEYQLEGHTVAYRAETGTTLGSDGQWKAAIAGEAGYCTRVLVVRPRDPARFNGTVLLNWLNVSGGAESGAPRSGETYRGYAWVRVSAQEVGIYGLVAGMARHAGGGPRALSLIDHDAERYGELYHPGDEGSFDIFSQAARAVGPNRSSPVDPMGGLEVRRVLATGASQSAMRLVAYINAVHPLDNAIDGFVLSLWEGRAPALSDGPVSFGGLRTTIRGDVAGPVLVVNSEFEALGLHAAGISDRETVRVWEVAGAPHAVARNRGEVDAGRGWVTNRLSIDPVHESAIRHAHHWVAEGVAAPAQARIEIGAGGRATVSRDRFGNALGGIRLPELAVPTAEYRGMAFGAGRAPLFGASRPFDDDVLRSLYPTRAEFLTRWGQAVDNLLDSGAILVEDAPATIARGAEVRLPVA
jgi:Alpha/beta hydrolase domain